MAVKPDNPNVYRDPKGWNRKDANGDRVFSTFQLQGYIERAMTSEKAITDPAGTAKYVTDLERAIDARGE